MDCTSIILARWYEGESVWFRFAIHDESMMNFIVPKGFVCVDGVSLTVCDVHRREMGGSQRNDGIAGRY